MKSPQNKNLHLEEAVLDDLSNEFDYLEMPLSARTFRLIGAAAVILFLVVVWRVLDLGWFRGNFYVQRAAQNASQIIKTRAERGVILDRFGKPLLDNLPDYEVSINLAKFLKDNSRRAETASSLEDALSLPSGYIENLISGINLEKQNSLTLSRGLGVPQIIKIKNLNLPAVQVESGFKRQYSDSAVFAHIIGYTGAVDANDLLNNPPLSLNDVIGKSGVEAYYDKYLRGDDGEAVNYRDAKGKAVGGKTLKAATPGDELYLTIDSGLQKHFYNRLKEGLSSVGSVSGVGIAIDPRDGEILALVSVPSFDNDNILPSDLTNPNKPFFNRAVSGMYNPGSVIKPLVAYAALKEKVISPDKQIYSPGYLDVPNLYNPDEPSRFLDWRPQGLVDIRAALARSSNVYFYEVGGGYADQPGLGIGRLKEYWRKFGLGEATGIDLPAESSGFLPDPASKEKSGRGIWRIGDTYNVAIGQGDLLITPIQLVDYIAGVANSGKFYQPFLLRKIMNPDGKIILETQPKITRDYSADADIWKIMQGGMRDGVTKSYGTSFSLNDLPIAVAAKTGTAQIQLNTKTNAFFVGYAPADNPQVALLVLVEDAREGSLNAVPIAKDIFSWYYWNRIANKP